MPKAQFKKNPRISLDFLRILRDCTRPHLNLGQLEGDEGESEPHVVAGADVEGAAYEFQGVSVVVLGAEKRRAQQQRIDAQTNAARRLPARVQHATGRLLVGRLRNFLVQGIQGAFGVARVALTNQQVRLLAEAIQRVEYSQLVSQRRPVNIMDYDSCEKEAFDECLVQCTTPFSLSSHLVGSTSCFKTTNNFQVKF